MAHPLPWFLEQHLFSPTVFSIYRDHNSERRIFFWTTDALSIEAQPKRSIFNSKYQKGREDTRLRSYSVQVRIIIFLINSVPPNRLRDHFL